MLNFERRKNYKKREYSFMQILWLREEADWQHLVVIEKGKIFGFYRERGMDGKNFSLKREI